MAAAVFFKHKSKITVIFRNPTDNLGVRQFRNK